MAVSGAHMTPRVDGVEMHHDTAFTVKAGQVLRLYCGAVSGLIGIFDYQNLQSLYMWSSGAKMPYPNSYGGGEAFFNCGAGEGTSGASESEMPAPTPKPNCRSNDDHAKKNRARTSCRGLANP